MERLIEEGAPRDTATSDNVRPIQSYLYHAAALMQIFAGDAADGPPLIANATPQLIELLAGARCAMSTEPVSAWAKIGRFREAIAGVSPIHAPWIETPDLLADTAA